MALAPSPSNPSSAWWLLCAAWMISLAATLGALFIGEVMGQTPCVLCWFQRAFMFPLSIILAIACWRFDREVWRYAIPLTGLGGLISGFHLLQYVGAVPVALQPCGAGASCTGADMTIFGGVPIPVLSLAAFGAITLLLTTLRKLASP